MSPPESERAERMACGVRVSIFVAPLLHAALDGAARRPYLYGRQCANAPADFVLDLFSSQLLLSRCQRLRLFRRGLPVLTFHKCRRTACWRARATRFSTSAPLASQNNPNCSGSMVSNLVSAGRIPRRLRQPGKSASGHHIRRRLRECVPECPPNTQPQQNSVASSSSSPV